MITRATGRASILGAATHGRTRATNNTGAALRALIIVGAAVALLAPMASSAADKKAPDELFKLGNEAFNNGNIDEAVEHYSAAVKKREKFKEAWYNLGIAFGRKKQYDKEIDAYKKAVEVDAKYTKALYNLAIAYEDKGDVKMAIETYERVTKAEAKAVDARINLGILYAGKDRLDDAIKAYDEAIVNDPDVADAYFNRGIAFGKKAANAEGDEKNAHVLEEIKSYTLAVEKNAKYHKAWYNLAIANHKLSNVDDEIKAYVSAIEAKADYPQALFNLAFAYEEKKDTANATKYWEEYIKVASSIKSEATFVETARQQLDRLKKASGDGK